MLREEMSGEMNEEQRELLKHLGNRLIRHSENPVADLGTIIKATRQVLDLLESDYGRPRIIRSELPVYGGKEAVA